MEIKKITFITYHNWITKRHGGLHQFAEYTCKQGIETVFFSFSRPYYIVFKKEERLNYNVFKLLNKGCSYDVGSHSLINVTWPTLALPGFLRKFVSSCINKWLMCHSLSSFKKFTDKWLKNTDCFVFESCDAVLLLDLVKKHYPKAQIVYRPSDPIVDFGNEAYMVQAEKKLIAVSDKVLLVNDESRELYKEKFPEVYHENKFYVVSNGVSVSAYLRTYDCPEELKNKKSALYIGAFSVDWDLVVIAAQQLSDIDFIIITPNKPPHKFTEAIKNISNILYIPGIPSDQVPQWITNANLIIQPFPENIRYYAKKSLGLTAQNYKAMAAKKPIVTFKTPRKLSKYGLITTDSYQDFINAVSKNITRKEVKYDIDIQARNWDKLCSLFMKILKQ